MSIQPVAGVLSGVTPTGYLDAVGGAASTFQVNPGGSAAFGTQLAGSIDALQGMQSTSDALAVKAVTGDLDDIHDYTIASAQAGVALELTAAIRNKAIEAFSEIMRMQA
ncbi:flagellar hook-basal body complex protein FliE [Actinotalea sp. K2]|uniref:flagellar hook-basal body complex protein FliE n=1 Tax=Actinotalea sp. K2 TaxID=2939438 RepID=UPI0020177177|nr:flagellar hook-basal body complex protein FliE [Actinotalea sp. K2]MCL3860855.1 flagellar hook-basal body complex protein FliE [Actinotalea sp. K2]